MSADPSQRLQADLGNRYVLERELGGMATVYFARDLKHDRLVALKVLHAELAATVGPERFVREVHPGGARSPVRRPLIPCPFGRGKISWQYAQVRQWRGPDASICIPVANDRTMCARITPL
jgi:serine/threonine protein kinase